MKDTDLSRPDLNLADADADADADDATTSPSKDEEKHLDAGLGDAKEAPARSITGIKVSPRINAYIYIYICFCSLVDLFLS